MIAEHEIEEMLLNIQRGPVSMPWPSVSDISVDEQPSTEFIQKIGDLWNFMIHARMYDSAETAVRDIVSLTVYADNPYPLAISDFLLIEALRDVRIEPIAAFVKGELVRARSSDVQQTLRDFLRELLESKLP